MDEKKQMFDELVEKSSEKLKKVADNWSNEATALLGIGYAILALAVAIKGNKEKDADKKE